MSRLEEYIVMVMGDYSAVVRYLIFKARLDSTH